MSETVELVARHGYWLLVAGILARQLCLPIPGNLIVVAAGAMARSGSLNLSGVIGLSVISFLIADLAWYSAGRRWGDRVMHFLCGLTRGPESCVQSTNLVFARHGVRTLLVSKFVFGLDAVAAPLTGMAGISRTRFLAFDALGSLLWSAFYAGLGYILSDRLEQVAKYVERMGSFFAFVIAAGSGLYFIGKITSWLRFVRHFRLARISPDELSDKLNRGEDILIVDLQTCPSHATKMMAIPGAVRIYPRRLDQYKDVAIAPSRAVVLYGASSGEYTSAPVALALQQKGVKNVRPLAGGLKAWRARGFPVTSEVRIAPSLSHTLGETASIEHDQPQY